MAKINYRHHARQAHQRADAEMASGDDERLKYAALELRIAMESLAYERVLSYRSELPADKLNVWQPRKIMEVLLELDPKADKTSSLAVARESSPGVRAEPFKSMGTDRVVSNKEIKKYYDKLGSYLHAPTVKQAESGDTTPPDRVRERCRQIADIIGEALASPVFNINIRNSATLPCERCGEQIVRRMPPGEDDVDAACPKCEAPYTIVQLEGNKVEWRPQQGELRCGDTSCATPVFTWRDEITAGAHWTCDECGGTNVIALGLQFTAAEKSEADSDASEVEAEEGD